MVVDNLNFRTCEPVRTYRFSMLFYVWITNLHHGFRAWSLFEASLGLASILFPYKIESGSDSLNRLNITHQGIWKKQETVECRVVEWTNFQRFLFSLRTLRFLRFYIWTFKILGLQLRVILVRNMSGKVSFLFLLTARFNIFLLPWQLVTFIQILYSVL